VNYFINQSIGSNWLAANDETCGENEKHMDCGTHCQPTCADPTGSSMPCNHMCAIGCFCVDGHVRKTDENSPCVHKTEC
jgi:hypothetical protein